MKWIRERMTTQMDSKTLIILSLIYKGSYSPAISHTRTHTHTRYR